MATKSNQSKQLKVTLIKSIHGRLKNHIENVKALGLRKIHHSVIVEDNPITRGMINKVSYMLKVEEV